MRYTREDACRAWLTHGFLTPAEFAALEGRFETAEEAYDRFQATGGEAFRGAVQDAHIALLRDAAPREKMHDMLVAMQHGGMRVIGMDSDDYPDTLRNLDMPPRYLFAAGDTACLLGRCITIVGSRSASTAGIEATEIISEAISRCGVTVVSGLAMGIDAAAHRGCLRGGSSTAAVLGCGLDCDYPMENLRLRSSIVEQGGVLLSEYPPGVPAISWHFPVRNRILAALGRAVLMMECQIRSGSMSTVQHALDQGKEVYAYPGRVGTPWAEGAHQLLREGANYFTSAEDVLSDLGWLEEHTQAAPAQKKETPKLTRTQHQVLTAVMKREESSFDQLCAETKLEPQELSVTLTMLQLMGLIRTLPGKCYARS